MTLESQNYLELRYDINGQGLATFIYSQNMVSIGAIPDEIELTIAGLQDGVKDAIKWIKLIRIAEEPNEDTDQYNKEVKFEFELEENKVKLKLEFEDGDIEYSNTFNRETKLITVTPRLGYTIPWSMFVLQIQIFKMFISLINGEVAPILI